MPFSRVTYDYSGTNNFPVNFTLGYLEQSHVTARVNAEVDGANSPVYRPITWLTDSTVSIGGSALSNGDTVTLERTVPNDIIYNDFESGEILNEPNLDNNFKQAIMLAHQVLDGRLGALEQNLNMNSFKINNLGDAVNDTDAVNFAQLKDFTGDAPTYATQAEAAATRTEDLRDEVVLTVQSVGTLAVQATTARDEAIQAALSLDLPIIGSGDADKFIRVNDTEDGYDLETPAAEITALSVSDGNLIHTTGDGNYVADDYFYVDFITYGPTFEINSDGHLIATRLGD